MIIPADGPLEAATSLLRALHVALNSPVVRQAPLPVGPASAAVALHGPDAGVVGVSVAIRSVRTGQVAFFTTDRDAPPTPDMAVAAALSFAEALGFVFDEDEVGPDGAGAAEATALWCDLIGEETEVEPVAPPEPLAPEPPQQFVPEGIEVEPVEAGEPIPEPVAHLPEVPAAAEPALDLDLDFDLGAGPEEADPRELLGEAGEEVLEDPARILSKFRWPSRPARTAPAAGRKTA